MVSAKLLSIVGPNGYIPTAVCDSLSKHLALAVWGAMGVVVFSVGPVEPANFFTFIILDYKSSERSHYMTIESDKINTK